MNQNDKAELFRSLHKKGDPLVLFNIWDAGGAKLVSDAGAPAVATGSWSVAAAHGYADGEAIPLEFVLTIVERIAATVDVPVSIDFEGGYAIEPEELAENIRRLIRAGAIGLNFEDRIVDGSGLHSVSDQAQRIKAIRRAAELEEVAMFINARTDLFLGSDPEIHPSLVDQALERAAAYLDAGADGFFVPGLRQADLIEKIADTTALPVNVMMMGELDAIDKVARLGAARASFGPGPYRTSLTDLLARYKAIA